MGKSPENIPKEKQLPDVKKELKEDYKKMIHEDKPKIKTSQDKSLSKDKLSN